MSKQITMSVQAFAELWDEVDTACMRFMEVQDDIQAGEDPEEIDRLLTKGYDAADWVRTVMQNIAEECGVSTQDMEDLV